MTSNAPDTGYLDLLEGYRQTLSRFVGPTEVLVSGDTLQLKDYSKTDWPWTMFDPEAKQRRHETVFPQECRRPSKWARRGGGGGGGGGRRNRSCGGVGRKNGAQEWK